MISYSHEETITVDQFRDLLIRSTLGERRPIDDEPSLAAMLQYANLLVTAWDGPRLVGIARSLTDHHLCCYLADLAVDEKYQHQGIGTQLIETTRQQLRPTCRIILLAAPAAVNYYAKVGFTQHPSAWLK